MSHRTTTAAYLSGPRGRHRPHRRVHSGHQAEHTRTPPDIAPRPCPDTATRRRVPVVAVPTTLGTGSEASAVARLPLREEKSRLLVSPALLPATVVLDPNATGSLPTEMAALGAVEILLRLIGPVIGP
ncbi:iron-containing alcohol dehydrogenase [Actinophytocola sp.]|uniref:iron-containing alcohol dehydrogenase n=1 Tax=Actinophytocola sp. TaxID=1872138 RepID=UPI002ED61397